MSLIGEVFREVVGMFVADGRLTLAVLCLVACAGGLVALIPAEPLIGGFVLVLGCSIVLVEATARKARERAGHG